mmetsp:Transcript_63358/g.174298  ORF Transcript_63358/g.174298 Transcript_63358/m.174298 type:complete len:130 (+) Transcript_63358:560-949(+)
MRMGWRLCRSFSAPHSPPPRPYPHHVSYPGCSIIGFILCFSVLNPESLQNAKSKWLPELEKHSPGTPVVLVGTKIDAREDPNQVSRLRTVNQVPVSTEAGSRVAEEMGLRYMECSAMTQMGLKDVFGEF